MVTTPRKPRSRAKSGLPAAYIVVYSPETVHALGREINAISRDLRRRTIAGAAARTRRLEQVARERRAAAQQPSEPAT
jgi:hypothetical protein